MLGRSRNLLVDNIHLRISCNITGHSKAVSLNHITWGSESDARRSWRIEK